MLEEIAPVVKAAVREALEDVRRVDDPRRPLSSYPQRMRIGQAATYLNCDPEHVRELIDQGLIEVINLARPGATRKCLRIIRESLSSYEARSKQNN